MNSWEKERERERERESSCWSHKTCYHHKAAKNLLLIRWRRFFIFCLDTYFVCKACKMGTWNMILSRISSLKIKLKTTYSPTTKFWKIFFCKEVRSIILFFRVFIFIMINKISDYALFMLYLNSNWSMKVITNNDFT